MIPLLLGVDGGSTATQAAIADTEGRILGEGLAVGCCAYQAGGIEQCREMLRLSISRALSSAGVNSERVAFAVLGLTGADYPEDHVMLSDLVAQLGLLRRFEVMNDTFIALRSGTNKRYGVCVVCGTGANAAAIDPQGNRWAFGGFCDWGGGMSLGKEALRLALRSVDGRGKQTTLLEPVLRTLGYDNMEDVLRDVWAARLDLSKVARLAPCVFDAAKAGDMPASGLLYRMGWEMALFATTLIRRFHMESFPVEVVAAGGLFHDEQSLLSQTFREEVTRTAPSAKVVRSSLPPVAGALLLAADLQGLEISPEINENLKSSCARIASGKPHQQAADTTSHQFDFPLLY